MCYSAYIASYILGHVQIFDDCVCCINNKRQCASRRSCIRSSIPHDGRNDIRQSERDRNDRICVCGTQRCSRDSSHDSIDPRPVIQKANVERRCGGLHHYSLLLLLGCNFWFLGLRGCRRRRCPHLAGKTYLAHCSCQPHGVFPCHRKLSG